MQSYSIIPLLIGISCKSVASDVWCSTRAWTDHQQTAQNQDQSAMWHRFIIHEFMNKKLKLVHFINDQIFSKRLCNWGAALLSENVNPKLNVIHVTIQIRTCSSLCWKTYFYIFIDSEAPKSVDLHKWNKVTPSLRRNAQPTCVIALWPKLVTTAICNQSQTVKKSNAITRQPLDFHSHIELAILFLL